MNFIRRQIKEIRAGGLRLLWKRIRIFPQWLRTSRYVLKLACYGCKLAVALKPDWVAVRVRLGKALTRLNRLDEAVACWKETVALRPDWAEAHINLGRLLTQLGWTEEAIECWRKAIAIKPGLAEAHVQLAETLIELGRFDEAFASWQQAFLFKPDWPEVHNRISTAFYLCGEFPAAQSIAQSVIDARNDFARAHQLDRLGIRFLREFPTAIGHIALLDNYVKMGLLGRRSPAHPTLLVHPRLANPCYLDYWRSYLPDMITDPAAIELLSPFAKYLEDRIVAVMDSAGKQIYDLSYTAETATGAQWEAEGRPPLLTLSTSDHERGWRCLETFGVPPDAWFVGLHVREGRARSRAARNADIGTYSLAMESIVARGGWVIRMGDPTMRPLPPMPQVIDYVHSEVRSDWMDVFLWARCRFFIATHSGPKMVPPTFGVPCVITNWAWLGFRTWFSKSLNIYKLHWSESEKRYWSFAEVLTSSVGVAEFLDYLASVGIKLVDNTPEEINDVVVEMLDWLEGKLKYSEEDDQLQERFNRLAATRWPVRVSGARVGRAFLRKWAHLL